MIPELLGVQEIQSEPADDLEAEQDQDSQQGDGEDLPSSWRAERFRRVELHWGLRKRIGLAPAAVLDTR